MIIISATLDFETKDDRDKAVILTKDIQMATRTEEEGCISYCFAADPAVSNRIQVYELWKDEKSLVCLLYTSPSPRDEKVSRMPSSA